MARGVRVGRRKHRRMLHRVDLERRQEVQDSSGQYDVTLPWVLIEERIPCHIESVSGGERLRGVQIEAGTSTMVELRYRSDLSPRYRFRYGDRYLYIVSARDPEELKRRTVCQCTEKEGDV